MNLASAQRNPVWKEARSVSFPQGARLGSRPKKRILGRTWGVRKAPSEVAKQNTQLSTASFLIMHGRGCGVRTGQTKALLLFLPYFSAL